ncbi:unnamed protein product [Macrosiphum euphorbiae]|uniref:Uncharacterized protein n=1 Tax=Macrosiphum euphorbiae TaxID=13131 RepID=A0AAV0Y5G4_9HEMI|nr:unnamed protein product [Macrosiphum euphorbiae]
MRHKQDNSSGWYMIYFTYNNIAVTRGYKKFTTYTDQQLNECKETSIYRICKTPQPIQDNNERQPCEVQNFIKSDTYSNPELCTVKKINLKRSIYQKLQNKNTWIHAGKETLTISCTNLIDPFITETNEAGEITIKDISCQVFARDAY